MIIFWWNTDTEENFRRLQNGGEKTSNDQKNIMRGELWSIFKMHYDLFDLNKIDKDSEIISIVL